MKSKVVNKKKSILSFFLKYCIFLILPTFYFISVHIHVPHRFSIEAAELILVMLPMIFTIISIALSLHSERIYGVSSMKFRRLRGETSFSFLEMIFTTIFIFALYTIFKIFSCIFLIWMLDIISVLYASLFIGQEVPILERKNDHIVRVIKNAIQTDLDKSLDYGNNSKGSDLTTVIQNLILENGLEFSYNALKRDNPDPSMLDFLLSKSNEYFFECLDRIELFKNGIIKSHKEVNLVDAITMAFTNLNELLEFKKRFSITRIYGNSDSFYQVTGLIFCLQKITSSLDLKHLFDEHMEKLLRNVFLSNPNATDDEKRFTYSTLNALLVGSLSDDDLWFLKLLRDSNYNSRFLVGNNTAYYYFVSMYLYYLCAHNNYTSIKVKNDINSFLQEEADGINADGSSWTSVFKHNQRYLNINQFISLLPKLLLIKGDDSRLPIWYQPKHRTSWTIEKMFSDEFIFDCWFEVIACNYQSCFYSGDAISTMLSSLPEAVQLRIAKELNVKWFKENHVFGIDKSNSFLSFYKAADGFTVNEENSDLIKEIKEFKQKVLLDHIKKDLVIPKTPEDLKEIKEILLNEFKNLIGAIPILDTNIGMDTQPILCSDVLLDSYMSEETIKEFAKQQYPMLIDNLIYSEIENSTIPTTILPNNSDGLFNTLKRYSFRIGNIYALHQNVSNDSFKALLEIPEIKIDSPFLLLLNKAAISVNIVLDEELSIVRKLNSNQINLIIDRDYKVVNGLYKYSHFHDESASVFVTRDEIFRLVQEKYLYASIAFKFKLKFDTNNLLRLEGEHNEEIE